MGDVFINISLLDANCYQNYFRYPKWVHARQPL